MVILTGDCLDDGGKRLTEELLGEKWHELFVKNGIRYCSCGVGGNLETALCHIGNRPFTTPGDRQALCERLREMGEWDQFFLYASGVYHENNPAGFVFYINFAYWLLVERPDRFCCLANEWLRERVKP